MIPSKSQRGKIERALEQHDRFKSSFVWSGPFGNMRQRQRYEAKHTWRVSFVMGGVRYAYSTDVNCSCTKVYYTGSFAVNGEKKTRRAFAKLIGE